MKNYLTLQLIFLITDIIVWAIILLSAVLGPKKPNKVKNAPFECGKRPFQLPTNRFYVRFYLIAMLFILFDIEVVFLFPWAVVFRTLQLSKLINMLVFVFVLKTGYV